MGLNLVVLNLAFILQKYRSPFFFPLVIAKVIFTLWEIDGETVETVSDFIFLGSKITANGDFTLTPWKESYDQPR